MKGINPRQAYVKYGPAPAKTFRNAKFKRKTIRTAMSVRMNPNPNPMRRITKSTMTMIICVSQPCPSAPPKNPFTTIIRKTVIKRRKIPGTRSVFRVSR